MVTGMTIQEEFEELLALCEQCRDAAAACGDMKSSKAIDGTIAFPSDGGRAHCIITFIYYEVHVPCETHHDDNSYHFLKPTVR